MKAVGHANMSKGCGVALARVTAVRPVKVQTHAKPMAAYRLKEITYIAVA